MRKGFQHHSFTSDYSFSRSFLDHPFGLCKHGREQTSCFQLFESPFFFLGTFSWMLICLYSLCVNGSSFLHVVLWVGVAVGSRWIVSPLQLLCTGPLGTWHVCLGVVIYLDEPIGGLLAFLDWLLGRRSKKSWHFPLVECAFVYSLVICVHSFVKWLLGSLDCFVSIFFF